MYIFSKQITKQQKKSKQILYNDLSFRCIKLFKFLFFQFWGSKMWQKLKKVSPWYSLYIQVMLYKISYGTWPWKSGWQGYICAQSICYDYFIGILVQE